MSADGVVLASVWELKLAMRKAAGRKLRLLIERDGRQETREIAVPTSLP